MGAEPDTHHVVCWRRQVGKNYFLTSSTLICFFNFAFSSLNAFSCRHRRSKRKGYIQIRRGKTWHYAIAPAIDLLPSTVLAPSSVLLSKQLRSHAPPPVAFPKKPSIRSRSGGEDPKTL